jgi:regulator of cell morphogenesis and NO signaling
MNDTTIDPRWCVNTTLMRYPETLAVFRRFKVDTCCGGAETLTEAARVAEVEVNTLMDALSDAVAGPALEEQALKAADTCSCCSTGR